jgi:CHAD domain-containing protein
VAKARPIHGLTEDDPYALAGARIVAFRASELSDYAAGVLDVTDIERVHDMRVATRRLRAALEVFEACFPPKRFKAALREVKALADALGERRDRDVTIAALEGFATAMGRADRPGIESLIGQLRIEQAEANEALGPFVTEQRLDDLRGRLADLIADVAPSGADGAAKAPAMELAARPTTNGAGEENEG